jgi:hypothetical protein
MGRTGNNQDFAFPDPPLRLSRFFYHPPGFDAGMPPPQIQFSMGPGDPNIQRGSQYSLFVQPNYSPEFITVNDLVLGLEFRFPGSVIFVGAPDGLEVNRLYVAYPPANAILEFDPTLITPNTANSRSISAYR